MEAKFWHEMWASGVVGFHQSKVNEYLTSYWSMLNLTNDETVLVPLCGKSLDMIWLAQQGHNVLGVELSSKALDAFISDNSLTARPYRDENFTGYELSSMKLLCGDFFNLNQAYTSDVNAIYDRAALVALPKALRQAYVSHLSRLLEKGTQVLLVTMEYDTSKLQGPPFAVAEEEVYALYHFAQSVEKLHEVSFQRKSVDAVEKVYLIQF